MDKQRHDAAQFDIDLGVLHPFDNKPPEDREEAVTLGILSNLAKQPWIGPDFNSLRPSERVVLKDTVADIVRVGMADRRESTRQDDYEQMAAGKELLTKSEQLNKLAEVAYARALNWTKPHCDHLDVETRIMGAVNSVFGLLENGCSKAELPRFHLTPIQPADASRPYTENVERFKGPAIHEEVGALVKAEWNYGAPMNLQRETAAGDGLVDNFSNVYDRHRGRLRIAAKDLFYA